MQRRWVFVALFTSGIFLPGGLALGQYSQLYGRRIDGGPLGCTFSGSRYDHGEAVPTPEACLNCTCIRGVVVCYLRVCPTVAPPGPGCFAAREPGQCCPTILCSKPGLYSGNISHSHHIHDNNDLDTPEDRAGVYPPQTSPPFETTTTPSTSVQTEESSDLMTTEETTTTLPFSTTYFPIYLGNTDDQTSTESSSLSGGSSTIETETSTMPSESTAQEVASTASTNQSTIQEEDELEFRHAFDEANLMGPSVFDDNSLMVVTSSSVDLDNPDLLNTLEGGCLVNGTLFAEGSALLSADHCRYCYCVKGKEMCTRPSCTLYINGCKPRFYNQYNCCPSSYTCKFEDQDVDATTTPTTTTAMSATPNRGNGCEIDGRWYNAGDPVPSSRNCHTCYCGAEGAVKCTAIECSPALEGCTPVIPEGLCCPLEYACNFTKSQETPPLTVWEADGQMDVNNHAPQRKTPEVLPQNFLDYRIFQAQPKMVDEKVDSDYSFYTIKDSEEKDVTTETSTTDVGSSSNEPSSDPVLSQKSEDYGETSTVQTTFSTAQTFSDVKTSDSPHRVDELTIRKAIFAFSTTDYFQTATAREDEHSTSTQSSDDTTEVTLTPTKDIILSDYTHLYYRGPSNETKASEAPAWEGLSSPVYLSQDQLDKIEELINQTKDQGTDNSTSAEESEEVLKKISEISPEFIRIYQQVVVSVPETGRKAFKSTRMNDDPRNNTQYFTSQRRLVPFSMTDAVLYPIRSRNRTLARPSGSLPLPGHVQLQHCFVGGRVVLHGSTIPNQCTVCRCYYGQAVCVTPSHCTPPPSPDCIREYAPGNCCPQYVRCGNVERRPFRHPVPQQTIDPHFSPRPTAQKVISPYSPLLINPPQKPHLAVKTPQAWPTAESPSSKLPQQRPPVQKEEWSPPSSGGNQMAVFVSPHKNFSSPTTKKPWVTPQGSELESSSQDSSTFVAMALSASTSPKPRTSSSSTKEDNLDRDGSHDSPTSQMADATFDPFIHNRPHFHDIKTHENGPSSSTPSSVIKDFIEMTPFSGMDFNDIITEKPQVVVKNTPPPRENGPFDFFKVSGCNIYGQFYEVGKKIEKLSQPCKECRCAGFGVECQDTCS